MELLFAYYSDYRNIKNQGFNFSAEYLIDYLSDDMTIFFKKNGSHITDFFPKTIPNVTVIVGENGVGKTSALNIENAYFLLFKLEGKLLLINNDESFVENVKIEGCALELVKESELKVRSTVFIRYSNYFDGVWDSGNFGLIRPPYLIDCTTNRIIRSVPYVLGEKSLNISNGNNSLLVRRLRMHMSEIEDQALFILEKGHEINLNFKLPEKINLNFNLDGELEYFAHISSEGYTDPHNTVQTILDYFLDLQLITKSNGLVYGSEMQNQLKVSNEEYALFVLRWSMIFSFINSFSTPNSDAGSHDSWLNFKYSWFEDPIESWFDYFFKEFVLTEGNYNRDKYYKQIEVWSENAPAFVNSFSDLIDSKLVDIEITNRDNLYNKSGTNYGHQINFSIDISSVKNYKEVYNHFIKPYFSIVRPEHFRNDNIGFATFSWRGLSSGELAILRLYTRIFSVKTNIRHFEQVDSPIYITNQVDSIIILIDEGDIGLHPDWQKDFIFLLMQNLPLIYEGKSIQIILTTHSPFVLSDVTNSHVIFLEKGKEGECKVVKNPLRDKRNTFGANIHSLLSDGFFLNDGLIGHYAKKKINDMIDNLIDGEIYDQDQFKLLVNQIGEPLIKKRIYELFHDKLNLEGRISQLERELKLLKSMKNDSDCK